MGDREDSVKWIAAKSKVSKEEAEKRFRESVDKVRECGDELPSLIELRNEDAIVIMHLHHTGEIDLDACERWLELIRRRADALSRANWLHKEVNGIASKEEVCQKFEELFEQMLETFGSAGTTNNRDAIEMLRSIESDCNRRKDRDGEKAARACIKALGQL